MQMTRIKAEITPTNLRCIPCSCPAVYTLSDGDLLIIGQQLSSELFKEIEDKVGADEFAVRISPDFFEEKISRCKKYTVENNGKRTCRGSVFQDSYTLMAVIVTLNSFWELIEKLKLFWG
jgi:hypothetical protein